MDSLVIWMAPVLTALTVATLSAVGGTFVVQRQLSFMGAGLAHAAFGGVALGLALGISPFLVSVPFTLGIALLIEWIKRRSRLAPDTVIGIVFALAVAMGVLALSVSENPRADAFSYLFGSLVTISEQHVVLVVVLALGSFWVLLRQWSKWAYISFDADLARIDGIHVRNADLWFSLWLALIVVIGIQVVGIILLTAFLTLPAATARLYSYQFGVMTRHSVYWALGVTLVGCIAAITIDLPVGPTVVMIQGITFFAVLMRRPG
jgi:zinc transport system permease protein